MVYSRFVKVDNMRADTPGRFRSGLQEWFAMTER
jgi:hypothetical protein